MSSRFAAVLFLTAILSTGPIGARAFETDQYNLSPVPLADIGDEVSEYVETNMRAAVDEINAEIAEHEKCIASLSKIKGCGSRDRESDILAFLRSESAVAKRVYSRLGEGNLFVAKTGKWFKEHKFAHSPDRYRPSYAESFYIFVPLDYATLSPTVKMFGVELGIDKLDHFFQQGYKYYTTRLDEISGGKSPQDGERAAVKWGKRTEKTYFGLLVSGVYSNADLYSNYAGMKFFVGLTHPLVVNGVARPATVSLVDGRWKVAAHLEETLIKPFISNHLNEALNPSIYAFNIYPTVKRVVTNQSCARWRLRYPKATSAEMEQLTNSLTTWNNEDYGWKKGDRMVPIASCFQPTSSLTSSGAL